MNFGLTNSELLAHKTVYADGLMTGKTVLISGAGSGLGKATAILMGRLGATVVLAGRTEEKLQAVADDMADAGLAAHVRPINIRDDETVYPWMAELFEDFDGIDGLINSAGGQFPQDAIDFKPKGWRAVIDTNLNGTWYMMQSAAQNWRERGEPGSIVNIVTVIDRGMTGVAHTCAARAGVVYVSKSVAVEWSAFGVRVNCIAPGAIMTEGQAVYSDEARAAFVMSNPMKRFGSAFDIAEACVYLTSQASNFTTGEVLTIDGGGALWGELWTQGKPDYFKGP